ncbi:MAG: hypothetical protein ISS92_06540, partial [Candidatus Omnitrophica bacterium]|nr:hypothetical protein [Candidatus Omnitrophota bacterium]
LTSKTLAKPTKAGETYFTYKGTQSVSYDKKAGSPIATLTYDGEASDENSNLTSKTLAKPTKEGETYFTYKGTQSVSYDKKGGSPIATLNYDNDASDENSNLTSKTLAKPTKAGETYFTYKGTQSVSYDKKGGTPIATYTYTDTIYKTINKIEWTSGKTEERKGPKTKKIVNPNKPTENGEYTYLGDPFAEGAFARRIEFDNKKIEEAEGTEKRVTNAPNAKENGTYRYDKHPYADDARLEAKYQIIQGKKVQTDEYGYDDANNLAYHRMLWGRDRGRIFVSRIDLIEEPFVELAKENDVMINSDNTMTISGKPKIAAYCHYEDTPGGRVKFIFSADDRRNDGLWEGLSEVPGSYGKEFKIVLGTFNPEEDTWLQYGVSLGTVVMRDIEKKEEITLVQGVSPISLKPGMICTTSRRPLEGNGIEIHAPDKTIMASSWFDKETGITAVKYYENGILISYVIMLADGKSINITSKELGVFSSIINSPLDHYDTELSKDRFWGEMFYLLYMMYGRMDYNSSLMDDLLNMQQEGIIVYKKTIQEIGLIRAINQYRLRNYFEEKNLEFGGEGEIFNDLFGTVDDAAKSESLAALVIGTIERDIEKTSYRIEQIESRKTAFLPDYKTMEKLASEEWNALLEKIEAVRRINKNYVDNLFFAENPDVKTRVLAEFLTNIRASVDGLEEFKRIKGDFESALAKLETGKRTLTTLQKDALKATFRIYRDRTIELSGLNEARKAFLDKVGGPHAEILATLLVVESTERAELSRLQMEKALLLDGITHRWERAKAGLAVLWRTSKVRARQIAERVVKHGFAEKVDLSTNEIIHTDLTRLSKINLIQEGFGWEPVEREKDEKGIKKTKQGRYSNVEFSVCLDSTTQKGTAYLDIRNIHFPLGQQLGNTLNLEGQMLTFKVKNEKGLEVKPVIYSGENALYGESIKLVLGKETIIMFTVLSNDDFDATRISRIGLEFAVKPGTEYSGSATIVSASVSDTSAEAVKGSLDRSVIPPLSWNEKRLERIPGGQFGTTGIFMVVVALGWLLVIIAGTAIRNASTRHIKYKVKPKGGKKGGKKPPVAKDSESEIKSHAFDTKSAVMPAIVSGLGGVIFSGLALTTSYLIGAPDTWQVAAPILVPLATGLYLLWTYVRYFHILKAARKVAFEAEFSRLGNEYKQRENREDIPFDALTNLRNQALKKAKTEKIIIALRQTDGTIKYEASFQRLDHRTQVLVNLHENYSHILGLIAMAPGLSRLFPVKAPLPVKPEKIVFTSILEETQLSILYKDYMKTEGTEIMPKKAFGKIKKQAEKQTEDMHKKEFEKLCSEYKTQRNTQVIPENDLTKIEDQANAYILDHLSKIQMDRLIRAGFTRTEAENVTNAYVACCIINKYRDEMNKVRDGSVFVYIAPLKKHPIVTFFKLTMTAIAIAVGSYAFKFHPAGWTVGLAISSLVFLVLIGPSIKRFIKSAYQKGGRTRREYSIKALNQMRDIVEHLDRNADRLSIGRNQELAFIRNPQLDRPVKKRNVPLMGVVTQTTLNQMINETRADITSLIGELQNRDTRSERVEKIISSVMISTGRESEDLLDSGQEIRFNTLFRFLGTTYSTVWSQSLRDEPRKKPRRLTAEQFSTIRQELAQTVIDHHQEKIVALKGSSYDLNKWIARRQIIFNYAPVVLIIFVMPLISVLFGVDFTDMSFSGIGNIIKSALMIYVGSNLLIIFIKSVFVWIYKDMFLNPMSVVRIIGEKVMPGRQKAYLQRAVLNPTRNEQMDWMESRGLERKTFEEITRKELDKAGKIFTKRLVLLPAYDEGDKIATVIDRVRALKYAQGQIMTYILIDENDRKNNSVTFRATMALINRDYDAFESLYNADHEQPLSKEQANDYKRIFKRGLPENFKVVIVPDKMLPEMAQTKPHACLYALAQAAYDGNLFHITQSHLEAIPEEELIGSRDGKKKPLYDHAIIYDSEDLPQTDQMLKFEWVDEMIRNTSRDVADFLEAQGYFSEDFNEKVSKRRAWKELRQYDRDLHDKAVRFNIRLESGLVRPETNKVAEVREAIIRKLKTCKNDAERADLRRAFFIDRNIPAVKQGKLGTYNYNRNIITRFHGNQYNHWFGINLEGLAWSDLPIPLGGTTNDFRTDVVWRTGFLDPHNVTEDADLGVRLYVFGWRPVVIDSVTPEQAVVHAYGDYNTGTTTTKQRSRWVKGYWETNLTTLFRGGPFTDLDMGIPGRISFWAMVTGTTFSPAYHMKLTAISIFWGLGTFLKYGKNLPFIGDLFGGFGEFYVTVIPQLFWFIGGSLILGVILCTLPQITFGVYTAIGAFKEGLKKEPVIKDDRIIWRNQIRILRFLANIFVSATASLQCLAHNKSDFEKWHGKIAFWEKTAHPVGLNILEKMKEVWGWIIDFSVWIFFILPFAYGPLVLISLKGYIDYKAKLSIVAIEQVAGQGIVERVEGWIGSYVVNLVESKVDVFGHSVSVLAFAGITIGIMFVAAVWLGRKGKKEGEEVETAYLKLGELDWQDKVEPESKGKPIVEWIAFSTTVGATLFFGGSFILGKLSILNLGIFSQALQSIIYFIGASLSLVVVFVVGPIAVIALIYTASRLISAGIDIFVKTKPVKKPAPRQKPEPEPEPQKKKISSKGSLVAFTISTVLLLLTYSFAGCTGWAIIIGLLATSIMFAIQGAIARRAELLTMEPARGPTKVMGIIVLQDSIDRLCYYDEADSQIHVHPTFKAYPRILQYYFLLHELGHKKLHLSLGLSGRKSELLAYSLQAILVFFPVATITVAVIMSKWCLLAIAVPQAWLEGVGGIVALMIAAGLLLSVVQEARPLRESHVDALVNHRRKML